MSHPTLTLLMLALLVWPSSGRAEPIQWQPSFAAAQQEAVAKQRPLLMFFWFPESVWGTLFEKQTLQDAALAKYVNATFIPVKLRVEHAPLARKLEVNTAPTIVLMGHDEKVLGRIDGYKKSDQLRQLLEEVLATSERVELRWLTDYGKARTRAKETQQPLLLLFGDSISIWVRMQDNALKEHKVAALLNARFVSVLVDIDEEKHAHLINALRISSLPMIVVAAPDDKILWRRVGYIEAVPLHKELARIESKHRQQQATLRCLDWTVQHLLLPTLRAGDRAAAVFNERLHK